MLLLFSSRILSWIAANGYSSDEKTIQPMNPSMSEGPKCTTRMRYGDDWIILDKYGLSEKIAEAKR